MSNGSRVRAVVQNFHRVCVLILGALEGGYEIIFREAYKGAFWLISCWL